MSSTNEVTGIRSGRARKVAAGVRASSGTGSYQTEVGPIGQPDQTLRNRRANGLPHDLLRASRNDLYLIVAISRHGHGMAASEVRDRVPQRQALIVPKTGQSTRSEELSGQLRQLRLVWQYDPQLVVVHDFARWHFARVQIPY